MYEDFIANAQGIVDYTVPVFVINDMMTIATEDGAVYITKEQAMKFFNLVNGPKPRPYKCCSCDSEENLNWISDWTGWRCNSVECIPY